jgi:hypothetical protein
MHLHIRVIGDRHEFCAHQGWRSAGALHPLAWLDSSAPVIDLLPSHRGRPIGCCIKAVQLMVGYDENPAARRVWIDTKRFVDAFA